MQNMKILNKKGVKHILDAIEKQWGAGFDTGNAFFQKENGKIYLMNRGFSRIDADKLRINSLGLYLGEMKDGELRLSIEGSQIIGPDAKKNVMELNEAETKEWMRGTDLENESEMKGFVIMKNNEDFLGCGKVTQKKVLNFVNKARRVEIF